MRDERVLFNFHFCPGGNLHIVARRQVNPDRGAKGGGHEESGSTASSARDLGRSIRSSAGQFGVGVIKKK